MKVRIEIDTQTFVRFWLVVIGFALVAFAIYSARIALLIIGIALFMAIALAPSVSWLARLFHSKSRALGTALAYVAVVAALGVIVFLVVPPIINQTAKFAQSVPRLIDSASNQYAGLNSMINHYGLQPEFNKFISSVKSGVSQFASGIGTVVFTGLGSIFSTITATILILVLAFLMLVEGPSWINKIWSIYSDKDKMERHNKLLGRMYNVMTNYVTGQLLVSSFAGLAAGVAVFILSLIFNIPADLTIPAAAILFVMSLIPLFGNITGAVLVSVILSLNDITAAIIFILFFILYAQVEANFISPRIQAKRINLSALIVLLSVTVGIYLFGIIGAIISIPIAGCLRILAEDYFDKRNSSKRKK